MANKTLEIMQRIIEEKKQKSASQGMQKRGPENIGMAQPGIKKKETEKRWYV